MMMEIKTTNVKSAWVRKRNASRKDESEDNKVPEECSEIMDILSLIPPKILNKEEMKSSVTLPQRK